MSKNYNFKKNYDQEPVTLEQSVEIVSTGKVYNCSQLRLRKGPSLEEKIITLLDNGTELIIESENDGWSKVKTSDGKFGYVVSDYISK